MNRNLLWISESTRKKTSLRRLPSWRFLRIDNAIRFPLQKEWMLEMNRSQKALSGDNCLLRWVNLLIVEGFIVQSLLVWNVRCYPDLPRTAVECCLRPIIDSKQIFRDFLLFNLSEREENRIRIPLTMLTLTLLCRLWIERKYSWSLWL